MTTLSIYLDDVVFVGDVDAVIFDLKVYSRKVFDIKDLIVEVSFEWWNL